MSAETFKPTVWIDEVRNFLFCNLAAECGVFSAEKWDIGEGHNFNATKPKNISAKEWNVILNRIHTLMKKQKFTHNKCPRSIRALMEAIHYTLERTGIKKNEQPVFIASALDAGFLRISNSETMPCYNWCDVTSPAAPDFKSIDIGVSGKTAAKLYYTHLLNELEKQRNVILLQLKSL